MLSIIIPTYNEKENIALLIPALEKIEEKHEIIVVDDNSPDGTAAAASVFSGVRVIKRTSKQGLTSAVVAGAAQAKGDFILVMDADLSHPPEAIPGMLRAMEKADLVIGSRLMAGGGVEHWPFHRRLISKGAELIARIFLGVRVSDPLSGFFAVREEIFQRTRFRTKGYKLLLNILADNPKITIAEIPYVFRDRHAGKTKLGSGEIFTYVFDLLRIKCG